MESIKLRKAALISLGTLSVLLIAAGWFWKERMLLCDAPHIAFRILNEGKLQIQQMRYGSFVTQSFPLIAGRLHLPLNIVLFLYSISFNLFYFLVGCLLVFRFKTYGFAILMGCYYTLFVSDTFYWPNNEVHQGIAWMFLCFGYIFSAAPRRPSFASVVVVLIVVGGLAIITHPLVLIPFVFLWGFLLLRKDNWPFSRKQSIILTTVIILLAVAKVILSKFSMSYDNMMMDGVSKISLRSILDAFTSDMAKQVLKFTRLNFWLVPILVAVGVVYLIKEKRYLLVVYTLAFIIGYFLLICLTFHGYLAFYTESELMCAGIIAAAPFVYFVLPRLREWQVVVIVAFIFLVRLNYIREPSGHFSNRVRSLDNVLQQMKHEGIERLALIKDEDNVEWTWMLDWGIPVESIMLSAMSKDTVTRQFIFLKPGEGQRIAVRLDQFVTTELWNYSQVNKFYFNFGAPQLYVVKPYKDYVK